MILDSVVLCISRRAALTGKKTRDAFAKLNRKNKPSRLREGRALRHGEGVGQPAIFAKE
jgi:hypothetical protein